MTSISLGRIGVGVAALVRPDLVGSTLGAPSSHPVLTQWFGSREIALGAATLLTSGSARRTLVLLGAAVDGADAATAYAAVESEQLPRNVGYALTAVAVVSGLLGLRVRTTRVLETV